MQRSRRNQQQLLGDVGIGITLSKDASGRLRVVELQDGGPAQKSQRVKLDDVVLSINGANVSKESEHEAMARLIGQPDTPVVLRLQQGSDVDGLANKVTWSQLVTMSEPDPESPNEEHFIVNGMRLTVPAEDDQGVFSVRDAKTNVLVYFGPGRYKGVWDILCAEGQQVASRPEIFMWRGQELYQPEYDARGIATVRDARTRDVVYRGPGDSYVPGHPGNSSQACPFVWLVRSHARAKRGRVMVFSFSLFPSLSLSHSLFVFSCARALSQKQNTFTCTHTRALIHRALIHTYARAKVESLLDAVGCTSFYTYE